MVEHNVKLRDASNDNKINENRFCLSILTHGEHVGDLWEYIYDHSQIAEDHRVEIWTKSPEIMGNEPDVVERILDSRVIGHMEK